MYMYIELESTAKCFSQSIKCSFAFYSAFTEKSNEMANTYMYMYESVLITIVIAETSSHVHVAFNV